MVKFNPIVFRWLQLLYAVFHFLGLHPKMFLALINSIVASVKINQNLEFSYLKQLIWGSRGIFELGDTNSDGYSHRIKNIPSIAFIWLFCIFWHNQINDKFQRFCDLDVVTLTHFIRKYFKYSKCNSIFKSDIYFRT